MSSLPGLPSAGPLPDCRRLDFSEIPVINLDRVMNSGTWEHEIDALRQACEEVGFFYISHHGVEPGLIESMLEASREFFALDHDEKNAVRIGPDLRGYLPLGYRSYAGETREGTSHQEGYWMGYEGQPDAGRPLDGINPWPQHPESLRSAFEQYLSCSEMLVDTLLKGFSLSLDLPESTLQALFNRPTTRLKINHYPPQPGVATESSLGVIPHTDSGAFTILWQDDNGGLEIQNRDGEWVGAPPIAETLVVNLGNIMQYWSNGRFTSTPHRVINRNAVDRYSIPLFVNPDSDVTIEALVERDQPGFAPFHYGQYQAALWKRSFPVVNEARC